MGTVKTGITLAADGEKEFRQAISSINSEMKVLQSELKKTAAEYSDNANSIEALTAKDKILNEQYDTQKQKIESIKAALENAKSQYGENTTKVNAWKVSLNNAEAELARLDSNIKSNKAAMESIDSPASKVAKDIKDIGESSKSAREKALSFGDVLKANVLSEAITSGMRKLGDEFKSLANNTVGFALDTTKALNTFQAKTGASTEATEKFKDAMYDVYEANYGENLSDISEAMSLIREQVGKVSESWDTTALADYTKQLFTLRDTFGIDMTESIRAAKTMMYQFNMDGSDAVSMIAKGAQDGLNFSDELIDSINEYSVQFQKLGLDGDAMFKIFKQGTDAGAFNLDKIGDAVKELSIRVIDGSNTTVDGFTRAGLSATDMASKYAAGGDSAKEAFNQTVAALKSMNDPLSQNIAGTDLFGTMWEDLGKDVVLQLGNIDDSLYDTGDTMNQINSVKYNDIGSAIQGLGRQLQVNIADKLNQDLLPIIQELIAYVQNNGPRIAEVVGNIAEKVATLITWIVEHKELVASIAVVIGTITTAFALLNTVLAVQAALAAANPVTWVIMAIVAAIALLTVAVYEFYTHWDSMKAGFLAGFNALKDTVINFLTVTIPNAFNSFLSFIQNNWQALLMLIANPFIGGFMLLYNNCDAFRSFIDGFVSNVVSTFWGIVDGIGGAIGGAVDSIENGIGSAIDWLTSLPDRAIQWGADMIDGFVNGIRDKIGAVQDAVESVANKVTSFLHFSVPDEGPLTDYESWMPDMMSGLASGIDANQSKVISSVKNLASNIKANIADVSTNVKADMTVSGTTGQRQNGGMVTMATQDLNNLINAIANRPIVLDINGKAAAYAMKDDINGVLANLVTGTI